MYFDQLTQVFDFRSPSAMRVPQGSDAQRSSNAQLGQMRFNTTNNSVEFYDNGVWKEIRLKEPIHYYTTKFRHRRWCRNCVWSLMQTTLLPLHPNSTECVSTCRKRVTNFNY